MKKKFTVIWEQRHKAEVRVDMEALAKNLNLSLKELRTTTVGKRMVKEKAQRLALEETKEKDTYQEVTNIDVFENKQK